jgi:hypothetical protein
MGRAVIADPAILANHSHRHAGAHPLVGAQRAMEDDVTHLQNQSASSIDPDGGTAVPCTRSVSKPDRSGSRRDHFGSARRTTVPNKVEGVLFWSGDMSATVITLQHLPGATGR